MMPRPEGSPRQRNPVGIGSDTENDISAPSTLALDGHPMPMVRLCFILAPAAWMDIDLFVQRTAFPAERSGAIDYVAARAFHRAVPSGESSTAGAYTPEQKPSAHRASGTLRLAHLHVYVWPGAIGARVHSGSAAVMEYPAASACRNREQSDPPEAYGAKLFRFTIIQKIGSNSARRPCGSDVLSFRDEPGLQCHGYKNRQCRKDTQQIYRIGEVHDSVDKRSVYILHWKEGLAWNYNAH